MKPRAVICGAGLVSPLAVGLSASWGELLAGRCVRDHTLAPVEFPFNTPRIRGIAELAAREALAEVGWTSSDRRDEETALIVATSKGPVDHWLLHATQGVAHATGQTPSNVDVSIGDPTNPPTSDNPLSAKSGQGFTEVTSQTGLPAGLHELAEDLARLMDIGGGPRLTLSAACASGLHAVARGCMMLARGEARRALVVAAESSLHPIFLQCFKRLGVVCPMGDVVRPFDQGRTGFWVSEAAAAICLEWREPAAGEVFVDNHGIGSDPTHLTGIDPGGGAMIRLIRRVSAGQSVDLIHAHGTGTVANDPAELAAILGSGIVEPVERIVGDRDSTGDGDHRRGPVIYSHKGSFGHSLGAAGMVAVVLSREMHRRSIILANPNLRDPIGPAALLRSELTYGRLDTSLTLAAGFGGSLGAIRLARA